MEYQSNSASAASKGITCTATSSEELRQNDPEAALRRIWDAQGVSKERQDELIAEVTVKAQPGAKAGPFTLDGEIEATRDVPTK